MTHPPGDPSQPQQTPPPERKKRRVGIGLLYGLVLFGLVAGTAVYLGVNQSKPRVGDCLSSMDAGTYGLEVVECTDAKAAFEVVERTTDRRQATEDILCRGHENGEFYQVRAKKDELIWAICTVPVT